ncbi:MAG TPA: tetratricopeptide repeat protein [Verrucomicrobiae bacterium]
MKVGSLFVALATSATLLLNTAAQNAHPDDLYLQAYELIQLGDTLQQTGQTELARQRYAEAQTNLKKLQTTHPTYSKNAVEFRMEYVQEKLKALPASAETPKSQPLPQLNPNDPKALQQRIAQLEAENANLNAKLQEALSARPAEVDPTEFARTRERVTQLEKEKELLRVSLEQAQAKHPQAADAAMLDQVRNELEATKKQLRDQVATVATLTMENQRLQASSTAVPVIDPKNAAKIPQFETLTNQLANLRARLEVYEARKSPYTREELALMDKSTPKLAAVSGEETKQAKKRELPPGGALLVTEAERAFASRRYTEAEDKYKQVVKLDESNPVSLANLAAIQLELQKLDDAESNLKRALASNPDDAYALSLMGMLQFQQGKYDEALFSLSRSAQLDPKNAETQNYLGITLSQKGQREPAEAALRKAILLNPRYAGAHHNLAVVYATQRPPFAELARFHYNKALALGQPANPDLEKQINGK